ncbi:hypothetical protein NKJ46_34110 [Mesorhizobium sp. M0166]|uniref:hypothetical protein n=1 Tax=Mesorhizobium sp. M0166 TaxID=2956902 RepID=UPI003334CD0C
MNFARANEEIAADVFVDARDKITTKFGRESGSYLFTPFEKNSCKRAPLKSPKTVGLAVTVSLVAVTVAALT